MSEVRDFLKNSRFSFNKAYGQNFITDTNLLDSIVADAGVTEDDVVIEIGAGAGTLTKALAKVAKKVIAFEIDTNLVNVLGENLKGLDDKVEIIFKDIQRVSDAELLEITGKDYKVVANLPYYITTPILMKLLECSNKPKTIGVMVQKEVGDRLIAKPATSDYGVLTLSVQLEGEAKVTRFVSRKMFMPSPNVDSCFVRIDIKDKYVDIGTNMQETAMENDGKIYIQKAKVKSLIKRAFAMRRKTLVNNLLPFYNKNREELQELLQSLGIDERARGETLSLEQFIELSKGLFN